MIAALPLMLLPSLLAQPAPRDAWLDATLEILNPAAAEGRRLLTVGQVVGPDAGASASDTPVRVVALVRVRPGDCADAGGACARLERGVAEALALDGGLLVLVVVPSAGGEDRARAAVGSWARSTGRGSAGRAAIAFDARGLAAHVLELDRRGDAAVVFADGRRVRTRIGSGAEVAEPVLRAMRGSNRGRRGHAGRGSGPSSRSALSQ
jgi:hypothetical protein